MIPAIVALELDDDLPPLRIGIEAELNRRGQRFADDEARSGRDVDRDRLDRLEVGEPKVAGRPAEDLQLLESGVVGEIEGPAGHVEQGEAVRPRAAVDRARDAAARDVIIAGGAVPVGPREVEQVVARAQRHRAPDARFEVDHVVAAAHRHVAADRAVEERLLGRAGAGHRAHAAGVQFELAALEPHLSVRVAAVPQGQRQARAEDDLLELAQFVDRDPRAGTGAGEHGPLDLADQPGGDDELADAVDRQAVVAVAADHGDAVERGHSLRAGVIDGLVVAGPEIDEGRRHVAVLAREMIFVTVVAAAEVDVALQPPVIHDDVGVLGTPDRVGAEPVAVALAADLRARLVDDPGARAEDDDPRIAGDGPARLVDEGDVVRGDRHRGIAGQAGIVLDGRAVRRHVHVKHPTSDQADSSPGLAHPTRLRPPPLYRIRGRPQFLVTKNRPCRQWVSAGKRIRGGSRRRAPDAAARPGADRGARVLSGRSRGR